MPIRAANQIIQSCEYAASKQTRWPLTLENDKGLTGLSPAPVQPWKNFNLDMPQIQSLVLQASYEPCCFL